MLTQTLLHATSRRLKEGLLGLRGNLLCVEHLCNVNLISHIINARIIMSMTLFGSVNPSCCSSSWSGFIKSVLIRVVGWWVGGLKQLCGMWR